MNEHIYTIKSLQPDILPESEYLPVYASFQSHIAFFSKKTSQKQATATLQNSKTHASSMATKILHTPTHRGLHPYGSTSATTLSVVALRHHECNSGQITLNIEIKTIYITVFHKPGQYVFTGISLLMRILS
jgi:pyruvate kinase